jgi:group I intron endonuclease
MYYTVYKTTNQINGKFYIGTHKTTNLNDDYLGSGTLLKRALLRYGVENFRKEILFVFDNPEEMFSKEAELVNIDFLGEQNSYNLKTGGCGGWDYINNNLDLRIEKNKKARKNANKRLEEKYGDDWRSIVSSKGGKSKIEKYGIDDNFVAAGRTSFLGKKHSIETKNKIGEKSSKRQSGCGNSQFGTVWIHNSILQQNKKISKTETIPEGWVLGRKMKF